MSNNNNNQKNKDFLKAIFWISKLVYGLIPYLLLTLFVMEILTSIFPFIRQRLFSQLIDDVIALSQNKNNFLIKTFLALFVVRITISIVSRLQTMFYQTLGTKLRHELNKLFLKRVSNLDYQHFENKDSANLIAKVSEEYKWRMQEVIINILRLTSQTISLIAIFIILVPHYWFLVLVLFVTEIPAYFINQKWQKIDWKFFNDNIEKTRSGWDIAWQLTEKRFISELKISNSINFLLNKFNQIFDKFIIGRIKIKQNKNTSQIPLIFISNLSVAFCIWVLLKDIRSGSITIGLLTFYYNAVGQVGQNFSGLLRSFIDISEQIPYVLDFKKIIELPHIVKNGQKKTGLKKTPLIEFKNISFKYPNSDDYIFKNLNLTIKANEEIAIVGINGAGKSTLIKLLCRFYDPQSGQILLNGIDIKKFDLSYWYKQLSVLFQEFNIYQNLTLKDNIIIGKPNSIITRQKIISSLKKSEAYNFIKEYKNGLNTMMGQRYGGKEPSWGQWQKIAIARIFYSDTPVLVLDEPTASIDATSEHKIFDRLYKQTKNKTLIIVSHRFSTVRNAQRIIVIDKGKIMEQGTHKELIKLNGLYAKSFKLQAQGYN
ncbi:ABC transporter ATP-binding protein/permease [Patescibacteria group bacterium]|nr:ABC transporter ATP-binding protein/permease [Patescibacteria group bacterium]